MMKINVRTLLGKSAALALATLPLWAFAAPEPEDIIKYRQNVMKSNGAHMAAIGAIINGKVDYKGHLADHARAVQAINKDIPGLFPKDSDFGDTKALDGVWSKRAEFEKRAKDAKEKSDALAKAVSGGDNKVIGAKFKELSDSCKACHKDFRKEEK
jgi:cytochrome c556